VWIVATDGTKVKGPDGKSVPNLWTGSGVLIDRGQRLVLTNEHVVNESCKLVLVLFPMYKDGKEVRENKAYREEIAKGPEGKAITAKVLSGWVDKKRDLALIQLDKEIPDKTAPIPVSSRSVSPGQKIHSMGGNPRGFQGQWVLSEGAVRQVSFHEWAYEDGFKRSALVIASQVPINSGDSGGPVVDNRGVLVGLNAMGGVGQNNSGHIDITEVNDLLKRYFQSVGKDWSPSEPPLDAVAEKDVPALLDDLNGRDAGLRKRAVRTLAGIGPVAHQALPRLLLLLCAPNESKDLRDEAAKALGELGAPNKDDFPALVAALTAVNAPDSRVRVYAADALGKFSSQGRQVAQALVKALDDPEIDVRRSVTTSLGRIGWAAREEVFAGLVKAVKDKERNVRVPAALNLLQLGKPDLAEAPTLKLLLADRAAGREGRLYAAWALGQFDSPDVAPAFAGALQNDTDPAILERAALKLAALKVRSKEIGQALLRAGSFPDLKVRTAAANALGALGLDDTTLPAILKMIESKDEVCRSAVMKAMPSYGALDENPPRLSLTKDAIRDIKPLLSNSEPSARAAAAYLLGTFGRDASVALPELRKALGEEKQEVVQCELLCALGEIGPEAKMALDELKAVMNDPVANVLLRRLAALVVVAVTNDVAERKPAYDVLAKALELKNRKAPAAREKTIHKRAKDALAKGGKTAALIIADVYWRSLRGFGDDKAYARLTALGILRRIGRDAEEQPVVYLLDRIIRAGVAGDPEEIVQAARDARAAIVPKRR
jgi:HEAT repeat protein